MTVPGDAACGRSCHSCQLLITWQESGFTSSKQLPSRGLFHCLCGAISEAFSATESSDAGVNPVGSTFNIQNSIPHKSQKTKAVSETNRAKEFQRGTAGVLESTKEDATGLPEGSDIGLGPSGRRFEPCHSDHKSTVISIELRWAFSVPGNYLK